MSQFFFFRLAIFEDASLLYKWRNDPLTQAMSHQSRQETYENHLMWLKDSLSDPKRSLYIYMLKQEPVGTLRLDEKEEGIELSWTINPLYRNKGIGKTMLTQFLKEHPGNYLAQVKKENIASQKICEAAGFRQIGENDNLLFYKTCDI